MFNFELVVLQPAATKPEELEEMKEDRPFVMRGALPIGALPVQAVTIPTIVDMIGFSSGGGPPGFAYFIDPTEERKQHYIWLLLAPGAQFDIDRTMELQGEVMGMVQCLGLLFCALEVKGEAEPVEQYLEHLREKGCMVFDMVPYAIPDLMKQRAFPHAGKPPL